MRRPAALAPLTALVVLLTAAPAAADPPGALEPLTDTVAVIGTGGVEFFYDPATDTLRVQLDGDVSTTTPRTAGTWTLTIAGTRGGVPFTAPVWTSAALTITDHKVYIPRVAPTGEFTVDWAYTGVGGYVVVHLVHQVAWTTQTGNVTAGTGVSR